MMANRPFGGIASFSSCLARRSAAQFRLQGVDAPASSEEFSPFSAAQAGELTPGRSGLVCASCRCRVLQVTEAGFYAWRKRPPSGGLSWRWTSPAVGYTETVKCPCPPGSLSHAAQMVRSIERGGLSHRGSTLPSRSDLGRDPTRSPGQREHVATPPPATARPRQAPAPSQLMTAAVTVSVMLPIHGS